MKTIFTEIIEGRIPCNLVYENDSVIAFLDINPASGGIRCSYRRAVERIDQLSRDAAAELELPSQRYAEGYESNRGHRLQPDTE